MIICSIISIDWAGKKKVLVHAAVFNAQCTTPLQSGESECLEHTHTHKVETHIIIHLHLQFVISSGCNNVERGGAPLLAGGGGGVLGRGSQGGHQRHGHARLGLMYHVYHDPLHSQNISTSYFVSLLCLLISPPHLISELVLLLVSIFNM